MKKPIVWIAVLGAAGAGFLGGAWYNQRERVSAAALSSRTVLYYVDPMHPEYRSDEPGVAPDCGMRLEPIYADAAPENVPSPSSQLPPGAIHVSAEKQQLIGVRVDAVEKKPVTRRLRLYGRVAPDETRAYTINIGIDGFVRDVSAVTTGSPVRRNQWLATYSAPESRQAIQGYFVALDVLERTMKSAETPLQVNLARASVQQASDRLVTLGMSSVQLEEIARTREVPTTLQIVAPTDGFVLTRNISSGQKFARGDEVYRIADLSRVWIMADVFGREADYVKPGIEAQVTLPDRGRSFRAVISRDVPPQFDQASQSTRVRLEVDNPGAILRPDMFVDVEVPITLPPAVTVPAEALLDSGARKIVFVARSAGAFEPRDVETGWRFGDRVEIVSGLSAGDRVVVSGTFLLDSESRITHLPGQRESR